MASHVVNETRAGNRTTLLASFLAFALVGLWGLAQAQDAKQSRKEAEILLKAGEPDKAFLVVRPFLDRPDSYSGQKELNRIVSLFTEKYPDSIRAIIDIFEDDFAVVETRSDVTINEYRLERYWDLRLLTLDQKHSLYENLGKQVSKLHDEGKIKFMLADDLSWMPQSNQDRIYGDAFASSLAQLKQSEEQITLLDEVISYVKAQGTNSFAHRELREAIEYIEVPVRYLYGEIGKLFPDYANFQLEAIGVGAWEITNELGQLKELLIEYSSLKDPFSVQFRRTYFRHDRRTGRRIWCGQYNAKNSWGAYGGWGRFFVIVKDSSDEPDIEFADNDNAVIGTLIDATCFGTEISGITFESKKESQIIAGDHLHPGLGGAGFELVRESIEVKYVESGSPAEKRGLQSGDIITTVNRTPVVTPDIFQEVAQNNQILFLSVQRNGRSLMLQIR